MKYLFPSILGATLKGKELAPPPCWRQHLNERICSYSTKIKGIMDIWICLKSQKNWKTWVCVCGGGGGESWKKSGTILDTCTKAPDKKGLIKGMIMG